MKKKTVALVCVLAVVMLFATVERSMGQKVYTGYKMEVTEDAITAFKYAKGKKKVHRSYHVRKYKYIILANDEKAEYGIVFCRNECVALSGKSFEARYVKKGNTVYRFDRQQLDKIFRDMGKINKQKRMQG